MLEVGLHAGEELGGEHVLPLPVEAAVPPQLTEPLARALDRVLLLVEEVLHEEDELDLLRAVDPVARAVLRGTEHVELRLPVAEHVRLEAGEVADLSDRVVDLARDRLAHDHSSGLGSRSRSAVSASSGLLPRCTIPWTSSVMGI